MPEVSSPLLPRRELAVTLRRLRLEAGKTLNDAAAALEVSSATISRYETGHRLPRGRDVRDLGLLYGLVPGERLDRLVALATDAREPGWWESYSELEEEAHATWIGLEAAAQVIDIFEVTIFPGLVQTPEYARALLRSGPFRLSGKPYTEDEIEHHIEIRRRRVASLAQRAVKVRVVVDEAVICRQVGSRYVMRDQVEHVAEMADQGRIELRIFPFNAGAYPGALGSFMIASVESDVLKGVVYTHSMSGEVVVDDATEINRYRSIFSRIYEMSLGGRESVELMRADR